VVRGAGGACGSAVVLLIGPTRHVLLSCSHVYAQFVICRVYLTFSFLMQEH
jgi:hypothetical protein